MKKMLYGLTVIVLVFSQMLIANPAHAADGFSQLQITTQYPIKSITVSGVNQNDDAATYEQEFGNDSDVTVLTIFDWWWRFKFFAEVECTWYQRVFGGCDDSDFPQPDAISPYVWIRYIDGTLKHKRCTPPGYYSTIVNMVSCDFAYDGPEGEEDGGNGPDPSADPAYDSDRDGVPDAQDWCPTIGDEGYGLDANGCPIPPPDLIVTEVSPVQAVYNANFDADDNSELILNKPLAVRIKLEITSPSLIQDDQLIGIQASLQGKVAAKDFKASDVKDGKYVYLVLADTPNKVENGAVLSVIVDLAKKIKESNEDNNQKDVQVDIVQAYGMNNAIVRVGLETPAVKVPDASGVQTKISSEWNPYLEAIYPVSPSDISYTILEDDLTVIYPVTSQGQTVCPSIYSSQQSIDLCKLLATIYFQGQSSASGHGRVVGIAEAALFNQVYPSNGFTLRGALNTHYPSALVSMVSPDSTLAHELGHTFGFVEKEDVDNYTKVSADGYWVEKPQTQEGSFDFMRYIHPRWITADRYKTLFNNTFSKSGTPPTYSTSENTRGVMLAGSVSEDGAVSLFGPYYTEQSSFIATGGNLEFQTFDIKNNSLTSTGFGTFNTLLGDNGETVDLHVSVFTFTAPFPQDAVFAEIATENKSIYRMNLHTSLLRQAVTSLPDQAFVKHPQQTRNTLYSQIGALEKQYERADINGVINHLEAIRKYTDLWLVPGYKASTEIEFSHDKFLQLIDELLRRLQ